MIGIHLCIPEPCPPLWKGEVCASVVHREAPQGSCKGMGSCGGSRMLGATGVTAVGHEAWGMLSSPGVGGTSNKGF